MNKFLQLVITLFLIFNSYMFVFADTGETNASLTLDGSPITCNKQTGIPFIDSNNRTQVPLRVIMEACNGKVSWNSNTRVASVNKNGTVVAVPIGASYILVNGVKTPIDSPAIIKNDRTFLPIRAVLEAFGYSLGYDGSTRTIKILSLDSSNGTIPMEIHFIDVGQGDCEFIDFGEYEILIDGGTIQSGPKVVNYVKPFINGKLELYIATHPDYDHIGAGADILRSFDVETVIQSGFLKDTESDNGYRQALSEENCQVINDEDMSIDMGNGAFINIIETGDDYEEVNNDSVVAMLTYGKNKVLFAGDMETEAEIQSLSKFSDVSVLKAGHHGSNSSSSAEFLNVVKPEYTIISCGENNGAYHPHKRALARILDSGSIILGTFKSGTLVMTANKSDYYWNIVEPMTLKDAGIYHIPIP